jgi:hypothetical protein
LSGKSTKTGNVAGLILLGLVGGCALLLIAVPSPEPTSAEAAIRKMEMAMIRCQNELRSRLADADGFDVEPYGQWLADMSHGEDALSFQFQAKVRNQFGALIWSTVECDASYDGKYWSAEVRLP